MNAGMVLLEIVGKAKMLPDVRIVKTYPKCLEFSAMYPSVLKRRNVDLQGLWAVRLLVWGILPSVRCFCGGTCFLGTYIYIYTYTQT